MNEQWKELSWENLFEEYYGRMPSNIQNAGRYIPKQVIIDERIIELPSARNLQEGEKKLKSYVKGSKKRQTNGWTNDKKTHFVT